MPQRRIIARRSRTLKVSVLAAVAIAVIAMWAVAGISIEVARQAAIDHGRTEAANLSAGFAEEMHRTIGDINGAMMLVAQQIVAHDGNYDLFAMRQKMPLLSSETLQASFVTPDGLLRSSTLTANVGRVDLSDREHIRVQLDGSAHGLFISKPVTGRVSHQVTLQFTRRVETKDGRLLGVLVFSVPPAALTALHKQVNLGSHGFIGLVGLDNVVRARFAADSVDGTKGIGHVVAGPSPAQVASNNEGFVIRASSLDHVSRIISNRRIPEYPLVVAAGLDLDTVLADARGYSKVAIAVVGSTTLLLALLVVYLTKEIGRRAAREISLIEERLKLEAANANLVASKERAERAEAQLADAVNCISEAFVIYDKDDRLVMCNDAYRSAYPRSMEHIRPGITFEELLRHGVARGEYPEAIGNEEKWLRGRLRRHRDACDIVDQALADGRYLWITERRMKSGGIAGLRIDVTKLVHAKQASKEALAKAEAANEAKSLFLANMSHELRTPLNAIIGFSEMMAAKGFAAANPASCADYAGDIHAAGKHLLEIINDVLDMSRIESGADKLKEEPVDVGHLVRTAIMTVRPQAERKEVILAQSLPVHPVTLWADDLRLRQVLINLLSNAVKFTPARGRVTLSFVAAGAGASFIVTDTGIGMSSKEISRALEPFQQIENSMVKRHEGVGLGLTLAKRLTEMHGGTLAIESEKGVGTTMRVTLATDRILSDIEKSAAVA